MSGVNKAILLGNLGKDPEVKPLESGRMGYTAYPDQTGNGLVC
jgi:single-stranded DNA-binding protein